MQDINTSEREISNRNHGKNVSRFEPLALRPCLHRQWRIFTIMIPQDHSVLQDHSWTGKSLTCSRKNNTREPASSLSWQPLQFLQIQGWNLCDHFLIINKHSHTQRSLEDVYSIRWPMLVWDKLDRFCGE